MDRESQQSALLSSILRKLDDLERRLRKLEGLDGGERVNDWVPIISQPGALNHTTNAAYYAVFGDLVFIHMNVNMDAAGTGGQDLVISGLPYAAALGTDQPCIGSFRYWNAVTGYIGSVVVSVANAANFLFQTHTGANFTVAVDTSTQLSFTAFYRRA